ncbi:Malonyl-coenzymeanthocyanin 3-O-glucoside-6''-O-malonyltransferase [Hordeum vulgare]|nr:Malonyl-coenzymeanthocyanin 3-O-glucoside-6''-O-malonyltransferase [Hordeum vulgare]
MGISDAQWRADVQCREAVTTVQWIKLDAKRVRDATIVATIDRAEASQAGIMNPPGRNPHAVWSHQANLSPTMSPWGYAPSRGYSDGDAHGGYNPNTTFLHGMMHLSSPTGFSHDQRTPSPAFNASLNT